MEVEAKLFRSAKQISMKSLHKLSIIIFSAVYVAYNIRKN